MSTDCHNADHINITMGNSIPLKKYPGQISAISTEDSVENVGAIY